MFLYGGVVVVPPLLGALHDAVHSWPLVWAAATAAVLTVAVLLAFGPRHLIRVPSGEAPVSEAQPLPPAVAAGGGSS